MTETLNKILNWIKDVLPTAYSVGLMVYYFMVRRIKQLNVLVDSTELERKKLENEKKINAQYVDMSDADIIRDAIKRTTDKPKDHGNDPKPK